MPRNIDKYKKRIRLQGLNMNIDIRYDDNMFNSLIPVENIEWINKQLDYTNKTIKTKEYNLLFLLINYSIKMFNFFLIKDIDKQLLKEEYKEWKRLKLDPYKSINSLVKYINASPKSDKQLIVYCGVSYEKYILMTSKDIYVSNIFISSTFDIQHAMKYAKSRSYIYYYDNTGKRVHTRNREIPYIVLKFIVSPNVSMIYSIYENQIIFPPNTKFKTIGSELQYLHYKDILSNEISSRLHAVNIVSMNVLVN